MGHVYLREWRRAAAWFALVVGSALVLLAVFTDPATVDPASVPGVVTIPVAALLLLSTLDAYLIASRSVSGANVDGESSASCPYCGKELDEDLSFCPWCTTRFDGEGTTSR
jgi:hypothetical protein